MNPSYGALGHHISKERKLQISLEQRGKPKNLPWKGKHRSEITKSKIREARLIQTFPLHSTKIELLAQESLVKYGLSFLAQKPIERITIPDQILLDGKIAIYEDGCYWHGCPVHFPNINQDKRKKDTEIRNQLKLFGWKVYQFWEHSIISDSDIVGRTIMNSLKEEKEIVIQE